MTRNVLATLNAMVAIAAISVVSATGCSNTGIGDPCVPESEYDPTFLGFSPGEVNVESKSFQCETRLCLANHFQGRVSCPYGQNASASTSADPSSPPSGFSCGGTATQNTPCCTPGVNQQVIAANDSATMPTHSAVQPNCQDRQAANSVYCSCRCANLQGATDDGAVYCQCPSGFDCTQLVTAINSTEDPGLTGAYCMKHNTGYDVSTACGILCGQTPGDCGPVNSVQ